MSLTNLTASGWVWFALTAMASVEFLIDVALLYAGRINEAKAPTALPVLMLVYLLWLVTP